MLSLHVLLCCNCTPPEVENVIDRKGVRLRKIQLSQLLEVTKLRNVSTFVLNGSSSVMLVDSHTIGRQPN
jgi:hypothetical protein